MNERSHPKVPEVHGDRQAEKAAEREQQALDNVRDFGKAPPGAANDTEPAASGGQAPAPRKRSDEP